MHCRIPARGGCKASPFYVERRFLDCMKLLIIRHADPDYAIDSLTEKGWREAEYLSEHLANVPIDHVYVSPLGRAKDTAGLTLGKIGKTAVEKEWLREFDKLIDRPDVTTKKMIVWDWLPQDWTAEERFFSRNHWFENERLARAEVEKEYRWVTENLDRLLASHGYVREGEIYRAVRPNTETVALFCHFGVQCVMLSHLLHFSPMLLWHDLMAPPSSVTTLTTEERREGTAHFRLNGFGDISHLTMHGEPPAFAGRFCECWMNKEERHD